MMKVYRIVRWSETEGEWVPTTSARNKTFYEKLGSARSVRTQRINEERYRGRAPYNYKIQEAELTEWADV